MTKGVVFVQKFETYRYNFKTRKDILKQNLFLKQVILDLMNVLKDIYIKLKQDFCKKISFFFIVKKKVFLKKKAKSFLHYGLLNAAI